MNGVNVHYSSDDGEFHLHLKVWHSNLWCRIWWTGVCQTQSSDFDEADWIEHGLQTVSFQRSIWPSPDSLTITQLCRSLGFKFISWNHPLCNSFAYRPDNVFLKALSLAFSCLTLWLSHFERHNTKSELLGIMLNADKQWQKQILFRTKSRKIQRKDSFNSSDSPDSSNSIRWRPEASRR